MVMAVSSSSSSSCLSNIFSFNTSRFSVSSFHAKPINTLQFKSRPIPSHPYNPHVFSKTISGISLAKSPLDGRLSFRASFAFEDSAAHTDDEKEVTAEDVKITENESDQNDVRSLKLLISVYKKAILSGDEKTICDVEAMIYMVENEKDKLIEKVSALSEEINSGKEKYIRLQADFDNFRKRSEKERLTIRSDAQGEVIESLLPMVDNFERAKQQIKLETEKEKKIDTSYQGIYKQFVEIMRSFCVSAVATVGKPFDPSLHEAIAREESHEFKEGIIIQEFCRGFMLKDRLLRPARVKVSAGPGKITKPVAAEMLSEQPKAAAGVEEQ